MNKKQKQAFDVVSRIDDDIIERVSVKRFRLLMNRRKRNKPWIPVLSAAACLVLIATAALLFWKLFGAGGVGGQIPVYTGMTVSGEYTPQQQTASDVTNIASMLQFASDGSGAGESSSQEPELPEDSKPLEEVVASTLTVSGSTESIYYAMPNQDVYITVHINNPDNFEILSFTLNGVKYSAYMFEKGSDMENLVLKINVGDAEKEVLKYTIDAIKYVDGETIKDVRMEGDQTVEIAVGTEKQPTAQITGEKVGLHEIQFAVSMTDTMALLGTEDVELYAVLYDGETLVEKKSLALGETNTVKFSRLKSDACYQYGIVAVYNAWDGEGVIAHLLMKQTVQTPVAVKMIDEEAWIGARKLRIETDEQISEKSLSLYKGTAKEPLQTLSVGTQNVEEVVFKNLEMGQSYRLVVTYFDEYLQERKTLEKAFVHQAVSLPVAIEGTDIVRADTDSHNKIDGAYRPAVTFMLDDVNIYAMSAGTVVKITKYSPNLDNGQSWIHIRDEQGGYTVVYWGLITRDVKEGDFVKAGQLLGTVRTKVDISLFGGYIPQFQCMVQPANGEWKDPYPFVSGCYH